MKAPSTKPAISRPFWSFLLGMCSLLPGFARGELAQVDQVSSPIGFLSQTTAVEVGGKVDTLVPDLFKDGYAFGYWTADDERMSDSQGRSLTTGSVTVQGTLTLTAHYFPEDEDTDGDGISDWFEYRNFGDLSPTLEGDPDGDGFTNQRESQLGQEARIPDNVEDGGISFASSMVATFADPSLVKYEIRSDPVGFIDSLSEFAGQNSLQRTEDLHGPKDGYHFAYWSINGVRQASASGLAKSQASFSLDGEKSIVAHYLPSDQDEDGDGIMDWFELNQFGNLSQAANDDPDGDGFTNTQENQLGQEAMIRDQVEDGGISFAASTVIAYASDEMVNYSVRSNPVGFVEETSAAGLSGTMISTPSLHGEKDGYHFAYWSLNGVRQATANGLAVNQVSIQLNESVELIAQYLPSNQDEDGDSISDWFELNQFGNLNQSAEDDPDQDTFTNKQENQLGQEAMIPDMVEDGGISFASSTGAFYFVQSYDRLDGLDLNSTETYSFKPAGQAVGHFIPIDLNNPSGNGRYRYQFVNGEGSADNSKFKIEGKFLQTNAYLVSGTYSIRVRVSNHLNISFERSFIISAIEDPSSSNAAPEITSDGGGNEASIKVSENQDFITTVQAIDPDGDTVYYSLSDEEDGRLFSIDIRNGHLAFLNFPDFENPEDENKDNFYHVTVLCSDGRLSDSQLIKIELQDVDEDSGIVEFSLVPGKIEEMQPANTEVGQFLTILNDQTGSPSVSYAMVSGNGDSGNPYFKISGDRLLATESFDFEKFPSHSIRVKVSATNGATQVRNFTIQIIDVLENTPPEITSYGGAENVNIQLTENLSVAARIEAKDPDGQSLVYLLSNTLDSSLFSVSAATGLLSFVTDPDYENPADQNQDNIYEVMIVVSDGLATDYQTLSLSIQDDPNEDTDGDGISDQEEEEIGTDSNNRDSDGDGYSDGEERDQKTDPLDADDFPGVIRGFDFNSLSVVAQNNDFNSQTSQVEFSAIAGETYYFAVDGAKENRGIARLGFEYQRRSGGLSSASANSLNGETEIIPLDDLLQNTQARDGGIAWVSPSDGIVTVASEQSAIAGVTLKVFKNLGDGRSQLVNASTTENFTEVQFASKAGEEFVLQAVGLEQGSTSGQNLTLNVTGSENQPLNDLFDNRTLLTGRTNNASATISGAGSELGEPLHALLPPPQKSVWWKWQSPADGTLVIEASGNGFSPVPKVYAGFSVDDLVSIDIKKSELDGKRLTLEVKEGVEYAIAVSGYSGNQGVVNLTLSFLSSGEATRPRNDDFVNALEIKGSQISTTGTNVLASGQASEPVHGESSPPFNSVWWKWTASHAGFTAISTDGSDFDTTLALYSGSSIETLTLLDVNDDDENSRTSRIEFYPLAGNTYYLAIDGFEHAVGKVSLRLEQEEEVSLVPINDEWENAILIPDLDHAVRGSNMYASGNLEDRNQPSSTLPHASTWWTWTAKQSGAVCFDTLGSSFDTTLSVYTGNAQGNLDLLAFNDDFFSGASLVSFQSVLGQKYFIAVDGKGSSKGNIRLKGKDLSQLSPSLVESEIIKAYQDAESSQQTAVEINQVKSENSHANFVITDNDKNYAYHMTSWEIQESTWIEGGETTDGISLSGNGNLASLQALKRNSGQKAFQLSASPSQSSWLSFDRWFYFGENSSIQWWEYFEDTTGMGIASIDVSSNGGRSWISLTKSEPAVTSIFQQREFSMQELAGQVAQIRFHLGTSHSNSLNPNDRPNWYIDDISFAYTFELTNAIVQTVRKEPFFFAGRNSANSLLSVEPINSGIPFVFSMPGSISNSEISGLSSFLGGTGQNLWRVSPWFGAYYALDASSWYFTPSRGWQFFGGFTIGGAWIYDPDLEWVWTNENLYPWIFQYNIGKWVFDYSLDTGKRSFSAPY